MVAAGFLSCFLKGPLPYVRCHITLNKIPFFLPSCFNYFIHCSYLVCYGIMNPITTFLLILFSVMYICITYHYIYIGNTHTHTHTKSLNKQKQNNYQHFKITHKKNHFSYTFLFPYFLNTKFTATICSLTIQ